MTEEQKAVCDNAHERILLRLMPSPPQSVEELNQCAEIAREVLRLRGLTPIRTG